MLSCPFTRQACVVDFAPAAFLEYTSNAPRFIFRERGELFRYALVESKTYFGGGNMVDQAIADKRLHWLCTHRSMREMDVILGGFFEQRYETLPPVLAAAFAELAELEDPDLWPLIAGKKTAATPAQAEVLQLLREARVR